MVAHLRHHFEFLLCPHEDFRLFEGVCERLLHIHMLTQGHRADGGGEVSMVGCHHADGVNVFAHLVEHLAEVVEALDVGKGGEVFLHTLRGDEVHIGERHWRCDSAGGKARNDAARTPADADAAQVDASAWGQLGIVRRACAGEVSGQKSESETGGDGLFDESAAG